MLAEVDSPEAAEARLAEVKRVLALVKPVIVTRDLYPKIVGGNEVEAEPGIAAGRYLVIAGACSQSNTDEQLLTAFFPESSVRPASLMFAGDAFDCPEVGSRDSNDGFFDSYHPDIATAGGLTVVGLAHRSGRDGSEHEETSWSAFALLRDGAGRLVALEDWINPKEWGEMDGVQVTATDPPTVSMNERSGHQRCGYDATDVMEERREWVLRAVNGQIEVSRTSEKVEIDCLEHPPEDLH